MTTDESEPKDAKDAKKPGPEQYWYVVHTYSGHENRARLTLLERVKTAGLQDLFGEVSPSLVEWRFFLMGGQEIGVAKSKASKNYSGFAS